MGTQKTTVPTTPRLEAEVMYFKRMSFFALFRWRRHLLYPHHSHIP